MDFPEAVRHLASKHHIFSTTGSLVFGATCTLVFCSTVFIWAFTP